jgi:predicted metalloprotease
MKRLLTRAAVLVSAAFMLVAASSLAGTAKAINPTQTTVQGVVNYEYWDLEAFWKPLLNYYGYTYSRPGVQYYDYYDSYGRMVDFYVNGCGSTANYHGSEGFYCPTTRTIYIDFIQQQGNLSRFGDGSVGFWLAHEFGHHIQTLISKNPSNPNKELEADCFAGMYVHYGIYNSGRLAYDDYGQARNQIWALSWNDPDHGTPQQRLNNFDWGYGQFYFPSCVNGY